MAAGGSFGNAPLEQFELHSVGGAFGHAVNFTQANMWMLIGGLLVLHCWCSAPRPAPRCPAGSSRSPNCCTNSASRWPSTRSAPRESKFFPFIFTLFVFVLMGNLTGLIPFTFTYTSHIAITGALALMVIVMATVVGLLEHGWDWFGYFVPPGAPAGCCR